MSLLGCVPLSSVTNHRSDFDWKVVFLDETAANDNQQMTKSILREEPTLVSSMFDKSNDWRGYRENRSIAFVHVGKAGGLTVRRSTSLACGVEDQAKDCIDSQFPANAILSRQLKYYLHMHGYRPFQMEEATSYLVVLRNPVDRLISSYRYSHPANCRGDLRMAPLKPYGCYLQDMVRTPGQLEWRVHTRCFPSPGMEDFAQSVLSPYPSNFNVSHLSNYSLEFQIATPTVCRGLAHRMIRGYGPDRPNPHMYYNYEYYMDRTVNLYPEKEVFGVRTEYEWEDLRNLDIAIGGTGVFRGQGKHLSHGSEIYFPSPLSTEAYYKLCCVLEREIAMYQELMLRVQNLNDTEKQEAIDSVRDKCGIKHTAFEEWRAECQSRIERDRSIWYLPRLGMDKQLNYSIFRVNAFLAHKANLNKSRNQQPSPRKQPSLREPRSSTSVQGKTGTSYRNLARRDVRYIQRKMLPGPSKITPNTVHVARDLEWE